MSSKTATTRDVTAFVRELETAFAEQWTDSSARWIIGHLSAMRVPVEVLNDAAIVIERWHHRLPTPRAVRTSVAEAQARNLRNADSLLPLPDGIIGKATEPLLERLYPDEDVSWDEHVRRLHTARVDCRSTTCDLHRTSDELAELAR